MKWKSKINPLLFFWSGMEKGNGEHCGMDNPERSEDQKRTKTTS